MPELIDINLIQTLHDPRDIDLLYVIEGEDNKYVRARARERHWRKRRRKQIKLAHKARLAKIRQRKQIIADLLKAHYVDWDLFDKG